MTVFPNAGRVGADSSGTIFRLRFGPLKLMPKRESTVFDSDLRYFAYLMHKRSRVQIARHRHWFAAGIVALGIAIWLGHGPIASIGSLNSLKEQKAELIYQLSTVLAEEDELIRQSLTLRESLPTPIIFEEFSSLAIELDTNSTQYGALTPVDRTETRLASRQSIQATFKSSYSDLESTGSEVAALNPVTPRTNLRFDLEYLLTPQPAPETTTRSLIGSSTPIERWITVDIKKGDSLTRIFKQNKLDPAIAITIAKRPGGKILNRLRTGPHLQILVRNHEFLSLRYHPTRSSIVSVNRDKLNYRVETVQRKFDIAQKEVSGVIHSSLYKSGIDNGLSQALLYDLTSIFQWKIDFNSEIRPGDRYGLVYEEKSLDGKKVSTGPILAAEFVVGGRTYRAIRHVSRNGVTRYFTPEGESLHGLFLRSPMRITRITSPYSLRRFHPVLKVWRAHKGVDYGGRTGDRVMATADGHVKFAGRKNNYGKVIILQHGKKYSTLYAHLSRFAPNIRKGRNVSQGQVIGYVGQTGLANGPHLHYEFRVHNVHQNPLTVKLPRSFAIDRTERTDFMRKAEFWSTHLSRIAKR